MKFLHTADWQVGMKAAHVAGRAREVRDERVAAGRRAVEAAVAHDADFIVVAGDTFEDNAVDRVLVQQVADTLARFPRHVYVLPGNHDPLCAGSVWDDPAWRGCPRVTILRDAAPIPVPGGTLWPCPLLEKYGRADPTLIIPPRDAAHGIRVGVAHGSVAGVATEDRYFPIAPDAADRAGVDYLAIGHWHSLFQVSPRLVYSGSHEPTKFGERDSGRCALVEIDAPGALPLVTPIRTGRLNWVQRRETCVEAGAIGRLAESIAAIADADATLLDLTIDGILSPGEAVALAQIKTLAAARFFYARVDDGGLRPAPDDAAAWLAALPAGAIRHAAETLRGWSETPPAEGDGRPAEATQRVAARALLELYALAGGGER